ncbi:PDDEXK nuclease domain-containing protein [Sphingobacterium haloxyli]|uniref:DUF1016 domain-containing protein n=1 Tax=Sphingobacterium haloxyli TaxID=2100533 RepID=A0A2S9J099_9SPHI|nr:PDDEXK nuclease domain-containing protein [Sphingobacterium haloxyli]PRD46205.1 DUF1016 domain-containing protein [Sphingobacterium haloxyli]
MEITAEYKDWITEVKAKVRSSQIKAALAANSELIRFYWELGQMISEKQVKWGDNLIDLVAKELKSEFPDMKGLSRSNLFYARQFYIFYQDTEKSNDSLDKLSNNMLDKVPWGHNILIFSRSKSIIEALFYVQQTIENGWSRDILALQIKSKLYERTGKAITNFTTTLPDTKSELAQQTLKDPYIFDFVNMTARSKEKDIEEQLTQNILRFLLELGKGFAFIGRQYRLELSDKEYFIDLLFYHIPMQCYVVVELKNKDFQPEYAGKLNFYLTLVDKTLKRPTENPTIGILLCRDKNNLEVEYALQDINKPMGVSGFEITEILPDELKSSLPTIEEIEEQLKIDGNGED